MELLAVNKHHDRTYLCAIKTCAVETEKNLKKNHSTKWKSKIKWFKMNISKQSCIEISTCKFSNNDMDTSWLFPNRALHSLSVVLLVIYTIYQTKTRSQAYNYQAFFWWNQFISELETRLKCHCIIVLIVPVCKGLTFLFVSPWSF